MKVYVVSYWNNDAEAAEVSGIFTTYAKALEHLYEITDTTHKNWNEAWDQVFERFEYTNANPNDDDKYWISVREVL